MSSQGSTSQEDGISAGVPSTPRGIRLNCITLSSIPSAKSIPNSTTFCLSPSLTNLTSMVQDQVPNSPMIQPDSMPPLPPPPMVQAGGSNVQYYERSLSGQSSPFHRGNPLPRATTPVITPNITPQVGPRVNKMPDLIPLHISSHTSINGNPAIPITPVQRPQFTPIGAPQLSSPVLYSVPSPMLLSKSMPVLNNSNSGHNNNHGGLQGTVSQETIQSMPISLDCSDSFDSSSLQPSGQNSLDCACPESTVTPLASNNNNNTNSHRNGGTHRRKKSVKHSTSSTFVAESSRSMSNEQSMANDTLPISGTIFEESSTTEGYPNIRISKRDFGLESSFLRLSPGDTPSQRWSEGDFERFSLRGKNYMKDKKKIPAGHPILDTVGVVIVRCTSRLHNQCETIPELRAYLDEQKANYDFFCNFVWVLPPTDGFYYHVMHLCARRPGTRGIDPVFDKLFDAWVISDDDYRTERTKFICCIETAPWLIRVSMESLAANKPALICKQLTCEHYTGVNFVEVDIDVGSSKIASMLNGIVYSNAPKLKLDQGFLIEGREPAELPERLITCMKFIHVDPQAVYYTFKDTRTDTQRQLARQRDLDRSSLYRTQYKNEFL